MVPRLAEERATQFPFSRARTTTVFTDVPSRGNPTGVHGGSAGSVDAANPVSVSSCDPSISGSAEPGAAGEPPHASSALTVAAETMTDARRLTLVALTEDATFADVVATRAYKLNGGTGALTSTRGWRRFLA